MTLTDLEYVLEGILYGAVNTEITGVTECLDDSDQIIADF